MAASPVNGAQVGAVQAPASAVAPAVAPIGGAPAAAHPGILGQIGSALHNFITQNPNTFTGNILAHGILGAGAAQRLFPYYQQEANIKRATELAALSQAQALPYETMAKAEQERGAGAASMATAAKTKAETPELPPGFSEDKDGNIMHIDPVTQQMTTVYSAPSQQTKMLESIKTYQGQLHDAQARLAAAKDPLSKLRATNDIADAQQLINDAGASFRAFGVTQEGQANQMPMAEAKIAGMLKGKAITAAAKGHGAFKPGPKDEMLN
jgi:hypothetical protein